MLFANPLPKKLGGVKQIKFDDPDENAKEGLEHENGGWNEEEMAGRSKYAKVNQPCPFSKREPPTSVNLEWHNIDYSVVLMLPPKNFFLRQLLKLPIPNMFMDPVLKTKKVVPILNNVSGRVKAGQVIAIMGPTGSGKTTLLNVLARRVKRNVTGEILVNGENVAGKRVKRRMAYVLQDDVFFAHLTVRNTINYTAYLKLPKELSWKEKRERVEEIITEMGLQRCANTIVGGAWIVRVLLPIINIDPGSYDFLLGAERCVRR